MSNSLEQQLYGANFYHVMCPDDPRGWELRTAEDDSSQVVIDELLSIRDQLDEVPHDELRIDTERIGTFLGQRGLRARPIVGVDEAGQARINEIIDYKPGKIKTLASNLQLQGYTYVLCESTDTEADGLTRDASGVHEGFHGNQPFMDIITRDRADGSIGYRAARNGFSSYSSLILPGDDDVRMPGDLFEEGRAQHLSHEYMTREQGLPNGPLNRMEPLEVYIGDGPSREFAYLLPGSYMYQGSETGLPTNATSAHAGFALQLLVEKVPAIIPAMTAARKDPAAFPDFEHAVDGLHPGMYRELARYEYKFEDFVLATRYIIDMLYDGDYEAALAIAVDQDHGRHYPLAA